jgi:hypothetical protein
LGSGLQALGFRNFVFLEPKAKSLKPRFFGAGAGRKMYSAAQKAFSSQPSAIRTCPEANGFTDCGKLMADGSFVEIL